MQRLALACFEAGRYRDTRHSVDRLRARQISLQEVKDVIATGWREQAKDVYKIEHSAWNYALRGRTCDGRNLRVGVSFERCEAGEVLFLITAMELSN